MKSCSFPCYCRYAGTCDVRVPVCCDCVRTPTEYSGTFRKIRKIFSAHTKHIREPKNNIFLFYLPAVSCCVLPAVLRTSPITPLLSSPVLYFVPKHPKSSTNNWLASQASHISSLCRDVS